MVIPHAIVVSGRSSGFAGPSILHGVPSCGLGRSTLSPGQCPGDGSNPRSQF